MRFQVSTSFIQYFKGGRGGESRAESRSGYKKMSDLAFSIDMHFLRGPRLTTFSVSKSALIYFGAVSSSSLNQHGLSPNHLISHTPDKSEGFFLGTF